MKERMEGRKRMRKRGREKVRQRKTDESKRTRKRERVKGRKKEKDNGRSKKKERKEEIEWDREKEIRERKKERKHRKGGGVKRWSSSVDVFCEDQAVNVHVLFSSWRQIKRQKHKKGEKEREKNLNEIQSESKLAALDFDFGCCRLLTSGQMNRKKPFCSDQLKKTRNQNVKKVATTGEREKRFCLKCDWVRRRLISNAKLSGEITFDWKCLRQIFWSKDPIGGGSSFKIIYDFRSWASHPKYDFWNRSETSQKLEMI